MVHTADLSGSTWTVGHQAPLTAAGEIGEYLLGVTGVLALLAFAGGLFLAVPMAVSGALMATVPITMLFLMWWRLPLWMWVRGQRQVFVARANQLKVRGVVGPYRAVAERRLALTGLTVALEEVRRGSDRAPVWQLVLTPAEGAPLELWPMRCSEVEAFALLEALRGEVARATEASAGSSVPEALQQLVERPKQEE